MEYKILISIIVPIYNVEKYLHKCIESLLSQTYSNYEIILVNDGSPDNCGKICDDFQKKSEKIKVLNLENGGVCRARNLGMDIAKGEYFCFVDSDDWVEKNYLKDFIDNLDYPDLLVQQDFYRDFPNNSTSFELKYNDLTYILNTDFEKMVKENRVIFAGFVWNKIFKSDIIKMNNIKFDETTKLADDEEFNLKYLKFITKVKNINKANYHYIDNPNSITKRKLTFEMEYHRFKFQSEYLNFVKLNYRMSNYLINYLGRLNYDRFEHSIYRKYIANEHNEDLRMDRLKLIYKNLDYCINDFFENAKQIRKIEYLLLKKNKLKMLNILIKSKKKL